MKPLYALVADCRQLEQLETDGELDAATLEAITNTLEGIRCDIQVKATGVGAYILNLEAYAEAAAEAAKALATRSKRISRRADHMREYLRINMAAGAIKKIESEAFTLTRKANPPAVIVEPDAQVPESYLQERDPLIAQVVRGAVELARDVEAIIETVPAQEIAQDYLLITRDELADVIERYLPPRAPDKKRIAEALKAHAASAAEAIKRGEQPPAPILPGCRLEQGERLEIKP